LISALEQNTSLQILDLEGNISGEQGLTALAKSLPNMKGLQQIEMFEVKDIRRSTMLLLMEGFRKNTSLVKVGGHLYKLHEWSQKLNFLGQRNRFTPLLKASLPADSAVPQLGIWSLALAKVATEPDVLFHVLCNKPKLVRSQYADAADSKNKRKRDD
jgi:hypothetical protein